MAPSSEPQPPQGEQDEHVPPELKQDYVDEDAMRVFAKVRTKAVYHCMAD
jgi:hypothetical protein